LKGIRTISTALVCATALLASGCRADKAPDLVNGKTLFVQKCGSCHVLARANTKGVQGPDLDSAFGPSRQAGLGQGTVEGVTLDQIANVRRGSIMPPNLVNGDDALDVSAYVAEVAGMPGKDTGALAKAGQPKVSGKPIEAEGGALEIPADPTGGLAFASTAANAKAGALELAMPNEASVPHNIAVKGAGIDEKGPVVNKGGTSKVSVDLKKGKYVFYCSVPGHEDGGMKGALTIR